MTDLPSLREYCRDRLEEDRAQKSIRVSAPSLDEALGQASIELGCPVKKLEYEVIEKGSRGTLGLGRKDWTVLAYPKAEEKTPGAGEAADVAGFGLAAEQKVVRDRPGEVVVRLTQEGAFLKVTKPTGSGARATERMALEKLSQRSIYRYDTALVAKVVKYADGDFIRVGEYDYNPANQSLLSADITDQDMKAFISVTQPGPGGPDLSLEEIKSILESNGVVYGIKEEVIQQFVDFPRYNEKILVAEGTEAVNGKDARILYNFNPDHSQLQLKEKNGRVDFKELNLVDNVEAGQILAKKLPPQEGTQGSTVLGRVSYPKPGKDVVIGIGKNVKLGEDGSTAIATINGQVLLLGGKINVEPIYTVQGDVNFRTGNILFLGTVVVRGNVEDGFSVKAAGNIEILGSVGKCDLDCEGEIIVHQGIMGKNGGRVRSGANVVAKFIEHAKVEAEENVLVSDGIIHSVVDANRSILCQGRRASIVGGRLRAAEEINAKTLGSVAGTETILEVGIDPMRRERLSQCTSRREAIMRELEEVERNINTLENLKKVLRNLPEEKLKSLQECNDKRSTLLQELEEINKEIGELNAYLATLKLNGKVSASDRVYPGVKIFVKNESLVVRNEFKKVTFYLVGKEVRMTKYEPIAEELAKRF